MGFNTNIKPTRGKVLLRLIEEPDQTESGLFMKVPGSGQLAGPVEAEVLQVGDGVILKSGIIVDPEVKVGQIVGLDRYGGTEYKDGGVTYKIIGTEFLAYIKNDT